MRERIEHLAALARARARASTHRLAARLGIGSTPARSAPLGFTGDYGTWAQATANSEGYGADVILTRVLESSRVARDDPRWHERDGVLLPDAPCNFPIIACLLRIAVRGGGRLHVLDVGGALGSSYRQLRPWLGDVSLLRWHVVEQPQFVEAGRREFENEELRFYESIAEAQATRCADVALLSGVLSYLPAPYEMLEELARNEIAWVVVDRTPLVESPRDRIVVQQVPEPIYGRAVRYPAHLFARRSLVSAIERWWPIVCEAQALDGTWQIDGTPISFRMLLAGPRR